MDDGGWGSLALESDHFRHKSKTLLTPGFFKQYSSASSINTMKTTEGRSNNQLFQGIEFPINLNPRGDQDRHHDDNHRGDDENTKVVVGEVDFFSNHKSVNRPVHHHHDRDDEDYHSKDRNDFSRDPRSPAAAADPRTLRDVNTGLHLLTTNTGSDQSTIDDGTSPDAEDKKAKNEVAVLQAELERMNAENHKLKSVLTQVSNNYQTLQMQVATFMQQQQLQKGETGNTQQQEVVQGKAEERKLVPRQFLDLGPGAKKEADEMTSQTMSDEERTLDQSGSPPNNMEVASKMNSNNDSASFDHGKSVRDDSPDYSDAQGWVPNKLPKLSPPKPNGPIDQATTEATMRKARVSVRARSEAPMISDGCQWRKYGQKMAKGNPCPRAYYRCTMAVGCPVRKQVQRCAEDRSILITTYEGNHNHPLPPAAMAMASTTSAAASMLLSGSMPSGDGLMNPNFLARTILPCSSSMATISASAPFPTVTLDLTHSSNPFQFQRPTVPQPTAPFQLPFSAQNGSMPPNFLASFPQLFGQALYNNNQSKFSGLHSSSNAAQLQSPNQNAAFADTLSAATAAIASDPNFTAALAAAISSVIGGTPPAGESGATAISAPENSPGATTTSGNSNANNVT